MSVIPVSTDNIDHLKRLTRLALPQVGSSHLSEAIASLFGYRTQAALLASMSSGTHTPILVRMDPDRFVGRLRDLGHELVSVPDALLGPDPDLPSPAWREFKTGDLAGVNSWFRTCQGLGLPYVYVTTRRLLARLDWDWITVDRSLDGNLQQPDKQQIVDRLFDAFRKVPSPRKAEFNGSSFVGQVDGLTFAGARVLASEVALILNEAQRLISSEAS